MSTDRELLELAAKAVGIKIDKSSTNGGGAGNTGFDMAGNAVLDWHNNKKWNPINDDGDRLRLIRALKMNIDYADCGVSARYNCGRHLAQEWWGGDEGDEAHAVLRVAAEIGKAMP